MVNAIASNNRMMVFTLCCNGVNEDLSDFAWATIPLATDSTLTLVAWYRAVPEMQNDPA
jgi:hypothetical protein